MRPLKRARAPLAAAALAGLLWGCEKPAERSRAEAKPAKTAGVPSAATFVGEEGCAKCHASEAARWKGSHHALAMQEANEATVLGSFRDATFTHYGVTSTFSRKDGRFVVRTDGPDGKLHEYPVAYTFGVYPLQQYLIAFPGGRYQALNVVWDTRPARDGGQRWFHLYPKEPVAHDDPLHWTGIYQNWNHMCAECHSTNVRKGYDAARSAYATTWSEINVSCEACHGPGSRHAAWAGAVRAGRAAAGDADKGLVFALSDPVKASWIFDPATGIARRSVPRTSRAEVEMCGRCHSRRSVVASDYAWGKPLWDTHRPALLDQGLYYADGQIQDEVYEYGSFLQSRMYAAGVTCSDCHNPHDLKVPVSSDRVCAACHQPEKFDTPAHHFHRAGTPGARCTACHMPTRNYMVVHARHDHSFRVPRPDLSARLGTPDACTGCHRGRSAAWAADAASRWWGEKRKKEPHYGEAIEAGREVLPEAAKLLTGVATDANRPAIVRATALTLFAPVGLAMPRPLIESALHDADPAVRAGAVAAASTLDPRERVALLAPLLTDPLRTLRIESARALVQAPQDSMRPSEKSDFAAALHEYVESQQVDADRPEAHLNLGALAAEQGDLSRAEAEYRKALELAPFFGGAYVNLADLFRMQGREAEAEKLLRRGLAASPRDPGVHHALGLALVRARRLPEAISELKKAAELAPDDPHYACVYGLALEPGDPPRARAVLQEAFSRHPGDRELLEALAAVDARAGDFAAAADAVRGLEALAPGDPRTRALAAALPPRARPPGF
jgi:Flp pilus assembly protein TadD